MGKGSSGIGPSLSGSSGKPINIVNETDVWSYRHDEDNEPFVDAINTGVKAIQDDFKDLMKSVDVVSASELGGADKISTLGYYGGGTVGINKEYTDIGKMNLVYDASVKTKYHPPRGNKTGTEAVALHEMGHALTDHVAKKMGTNLNGAAQQIVDAAYKAIHGKGGTYKWAGQISGYAQDSYAECVAEAVCDWYCNGEKASKASKAIMSQLKKYA